jgi:hypothetical protein
VLPFPDRVADNPVESKEPPISSTGDPGLLGADLEAAERFLPDESDDDLLDPGINVTKAVFSTNELLSQTDTALVDFPQAGMAKVKLERLEDDSIQDRFATPIQQSPGATQDTEELFDAFGPGRADSSPERSPTLFQGLYDESSEDERKLLKTTSGFVPAFPSINAHSSTPQSAAAGFGQSLTVKTAVLKSPDDSSHCTLDSQIVEAPTATFLSPQSISIQNMGSRLVFIELAEDDTGHSLKLELAGRCGISIDDFHLTHKNLDIASDRTLQESGLITEDIVVFHLHNTPISTSPTALTPSSHPPVIAVQPFPMKLSTLMAETSFYVSPVETLAGLQAKVHGITGCQANMQMLTYGGARIESDLASHPYHIQPGERIYLRVRSAPRPEHYSDEDSDSDYSASTDSVPEMCSGDNSVISHGYCVSDGEQNSLDNGRFHAEGNMGTALTLTGQKYKRGALEEGEINEGGLDWPWESGSNSGVDMDDEGSLDVEAGAGHCTITASTGETTQVWVPELPEHQIINRPAAAPHQHRSETIPEREHRVRFQSTAATSALGSPLGMGQGLPNSDYRGRGRGRGSMIQHSGRGGRGAALQNYISSRGANPSQHSSADDRGRPGDQPTPPPVIPDTNARDLSSSEFCATDWENWFSAVDTSEPQPASPVASGSHTLYTFRLYIRSGLSVAGFSPKFSDVLIHLKKADPRLILMVWNAQDTNPGLTSITSIPTDTITLNKYYSRRTADPNQFQGCIRVKTCFDPDTLISKMQTWVKTGGHILTCMQCQAEVTAKMGALFRTTQSIHRGDLFAAIKDTVQYKRDGQDFQFGLLSSEFQAGGERVYCLIIEVDRSQLKLADNFFNTMWNNPATPKPLGLNCRYFNLQNPAATEEQRMQLFQIQRDFVSQESKILIAGCGDLDGKVHLKDRRLVVTVRQLFLNIRSRADPARRLLYGIERLHNKPNHYFLRMSRSNYDELINRMDTLESDLRRVIEPADYHILVSDTTTGLYVANSSLVAANLRGNFTPPTPESQKDLETLFSSFEATSVNATVFTSTTTTVTRDVLLQGGVDRPATTVGSRVPATQAWGTPPALESGQHLAHQQNVPQFAGPAPQDQGTLVSRSSSHIQAITAASSMHVDSRDLSSLRQHFKHEITTVTKNVTRIDKVVTELRSEVKSFRQEHNSHAINFQRLCKKLGVETTTAAEQNFIDDTTTQDPLGLLDSNGTYTSNDVSQAMHDTAMHEHELLNPVGAENRND